MAFLRATETSLAALSQVLTGQPLAAAAALPATGPVAAAPAWPVAPPAPAWPAAAAKPPAAWPMPPSVEQPAFAPLAAPAVAAAPAGSAPPPPFAAAGPASLPYLESPAVSEAPAPTDGLPAPQAVAASRPAEKTPAGEAPVAALPDGLDAVLLSVVAEKTGYPVEMLGLEMDMESDLGIDSIKRVEVFSGLRERVPGLPEIDPAGMASLRTLGQIVAHLSPEALAFEPSIAATHSTDEDRDHHGAGDHGTAADSPAPAMIGALAAAPSDSAPAAAGLSAVPQAAAAISALGRFALREVPCPPLGLAMAGLRAADLVAVTEDGAGIAEAVAERLAHRGIAARVVREVPAGAVVFLDGLAEIAGFDDACAVQRRAFRTARAVAARLAAGPGVFVTVQDTGGDFGLVGADPERAWLGGLPGLVKTAAQEWPEAAVKAIDLERGGRPADQLADAIVSELLAGGPELEVGLHADGRRTTLESHAAPLADGDGLPALAPGSLLLVSGGARGVTAACLAALAREADALRLVLLGRTALEEEPAALHDIEGEAALKQALLAAAQAAGETPSPAELARRAGRVLAHREVAANLDALRAAGAEVRYLAVDIRDAAALAAALAPVRHEWGPITGLVHGAGVLADRLIADKTEEQFDRVFGTKVEGLRHLLAATAEDPLAVICLFSSVAARCGNAGQSDYAMANEVLNRVAAAEARRRAGACRVKALNWGPWESGMVTPALKARFEGAGVPVIPLAAGARMLADELRAGPAEEVEVVLGGEPRAQALLAADARRALAMEAFVSAGTHPYLEGHQIHDVPVLPVVLVLEWFLRLARGCRPDLTLTACRDLKVLRGVRLLDFHNGGHAFRLHGREISNGHGAEIALELRGHDGHLHYTAVAEMAPESVAPRGATAPPAESDPWPYPTVYGDVLFHGPEFQVIRELHGISAEGMAGVLAGTREMGWDDAWVSDPAALDGGLQLAVLWFKHQLGGASLPTAVAAYRAYAHGPAEEPVHAVLKGRVLGPHHTVSDIAFLDGDGRLLAELEGVETHRRPGEGGSGGPGSEPQRGA
jgi:NADP-dependent 3-hydroxy acid dehydrogenase YdfG